MKKNITLYMLLVCFAFTATATERMYLKIQLDNQKEISYPPGINFLAQDENGNTILNADELKVLKVYEVQMPITLFVFTTWNDAPDVYEISSGTLSLGMAHKGYSPSTTYTYGKSKKGETNRRARKNQDYGGWSMNSNGVSMTRSRYFANEDTTAYNVSLEFSNGVIFYYRDGKATAWQDGNELKITGNYLIKTNKGIIKLSYNPSDKKLWWVFEKN